jgi:hypothetical protein
LAADVGVTELFRPKKDGSDTMLRFVYNLKYNKSRSKREKRQNLLSSAYDLRLQGKVQKATLCSIT